MAGGLQHFIDNPGMLRPIYGPCKAQKLADMFAELDARLAPFGLAPSSGLHVARIGVYSSILEEAHELLTRVSRELLVNQMDFVYVDDQDLARGGMEAGALRIGEQTMRAIVLPHATAIPMRTYDKLARFLDAGGVLVSCGPLPTLAAGDGTHAEVRQLSMQLAHHVRVEIVPEPAAVPEALSYLLPRDMTLSEPCPELLCTHLIKDKRHIYLIANCGEAPVAREVTVSVVAPEAGESQEHGDRLLACGSSMGPPALLPVEFRYPSSGGMAPLWHETTELGTVFGVDLQPWEAVLIAFPEGARDLVEEGYADACCFMRFGECGRCHGGG